MKEIFIYDDIGPEWLGMVSAKGIVDQLRAAGADEEIHLRIKSPGGSVDEADAIYNAIAEHKGKVIAKIDGLAASSASYIIMAADEIEMAENAKVMIHNAWTFAIGNKADLMRVVGVLEIYDKSLTNTYAKRTGKTESEVRAKMDAETWFTAQEAVAFGLADRIGQKIKVKACVAAGRYLNTPPELIDDEAPQKYAARREAARAKLRLMR